MRIPSFVRIGMLALAGAVVLLPSATPLQAQAEASVLRGRVADARDSALVGAVVVLHAVTDDAGIEVDRDTADEAGAFELRFEPQDGPLYFVATRIDGQIYMAEPFREPPGTDIVLRAGTGVQPLDLGGVAAPARTTTTGLTTSEDGGHAGWWVAAIALVVIGFVAWIVHRGRRRPSRARELLLEIARLDENRARAAGAGSEESYRARRAELRGRLVEALELDDDAHRH